MVGVEEEEVGLWKGHGFGFLRRGGGGTWEGEGVVGDIGW